MVHGTRQDAEAVREDLAAVLAPLGLRLSQAKTQVVHLREGFDFVGFHIRWRRKRGTNTWHVYTFIADRPLRSLKAKIRALAPRKVATGSGIRAEKTQPDHARMVQLLQARRGQTRLRPPRPVHLAQADHDDDGPAPLELDGRPPLARHPIRGLAADRGGRDRAVQHRRRPGHPIPLARQPVGAGFRSWSRRRRRRRSYARRSRWRG